MMDAVSSILQMLLMLAAVIALAYLILNKGVGKLIKRTQAGKAIQVQERVALDQKHALYIVHLADRSFLLGSGDGGVRLIQELSKDIREAEPR